MIDKAKILFENKKICDEKLLNYGFSKTDDGFFYKTPLNDTSLFLNINISPFSKVSASVIDGETGEPYKLFLANGAKGSFVNKIRQEYEEVLSDIAKNCFERDVFKSNAAKKMIEYAKEKYGDELEFLWKDLPTAAVLRRKDSQKWYAVLMLVHRQKLRLLNDDSGIDGTQMVEIVDLHSTSEKITSMFSNNVAQNHFPAYHMNKKRWFSVVLDEKTDVSALQTEIDESYSLAVK